RRSSEDGDLAEDRRRLRAAGVARDGPGPPMVAQANRRGPQDQRQAEIRQDHDGSFLRECARFAALIHSKSGSPSFPIPGKIPRFPIFTKHPRSSPCGAGVRLQSWKIRGSGEDGMVIRSEDSGGFYRTASLVTLAILGTMAALFLMKAILIPIALALVL